MRSQESARAALTRLRGLVAPDQEWSALRDDYADLGERWSRPIRDAGPTEDGQAFEHGLRALEARRNELAART